MGTLLRVKLFLVHRSIYLQSAILLKNGFLYIGMRSLNFTNKYLEYGQDAILTFFVFHQPVIIILAYYGVQWQAGPTMKLLFVVIGSFLVTLGIYEFIVRRFPLLRLVFGMKMSPAARSA